MKRLLLCLSLLFNLSLFGQSYHFLHLTVEEGLPDNDIYDILQDKRGAIWFATPKGVAVHDGVNTKTYNPENGLPDENIYCLYEDAKGHIWIGSQKGITVFNGKKFKSYNETNGLSSVVIKSIAEDMDGKLWVGTENGGACYLDLSDSIANFEPVNIDFGKGVSEPTIDKIIETSDGKVWFGGNKGLAYLDEDYEIQILKSPNREIGKHIYDLHEDINGDLWIAHDNGLTVYDGRNFKVYNDENGFPFEAIRTIEEDKLGNLWVGTPTKGVYRFDSNVEEIEVYNTEKGLSEDIITCIFEDNSDNLWVGTEGGGVNKFTGIAFTYFGEQEGLQNDKINGITLDSRDNLWFATRGGAIKFDGEKYQLFDERNGLPKEYVNTIFEDGEEKIWIATPLGLTKMVDDQVVKVYGARDGIIGIINCIFEDKKGILWLGTNMGLAKFDGERFRVYSMFDGIEGNITSISQDGKGVLWIGTQKKGIYWFNGIEFEHLTEEGGLIPSNSINSIIKGPRGSIFIGTKNGGVTKYDETTGEYLTFDSKSGLSSDNVSMMIFDEDNQLWVGSDKGLDRITYNPPQIIRKTGEHISEIKHYGKSDGIIGGNINKNAVCEDADGNLWFGTNRGAIKLDISIDDVSNHLPQAYITQLDLDDQPVNWAHRNYAIEEWSGLPKGLVLPYDSSSVTFHFVGINHEAPTKVEYIWYLEGFEDKKEIPKKAREAKYPKLPPGEYTFIVYACNSDDLCDDSNPAKFSFVVSPPFWKETWFIIAVALLGAAIIILLIKQRERKLMMERELLEQKVKERTQEVVDKNKELELVNLEINSKNKEIEQKNNDLNSSIRYALTIQQASFPPVQELKDKFPNSFIYHLPRDIVSGDFYWYRQVGRKFVMAIADCTGHGVPGALTSMIGIALLNEIVGGNKITDPALALKALDKGILKAFENSESETQDGMDIGLVSIDLDTHEIEYSGAYRPLILIRNGELTEFKATKMSIGFKDVVDKNFEKHTIQLQKGDNIYMFSDGYPDQFGGPNNKKFKTRMMKDMLIAASDQHMMDQKANVDKHYLDWKGDCEQVDDILVAGIKFE